MLKKILIIFSLVSSCYAFGLKHCEKYFQSDGTILKEFWDVEPDGISNKTSSISYIQNNDLIKLLQTSGDWAEISKNARERLLELGFPLFYFPFDDDGEGPQILDKSNNSIKPGFVDVSVRPIKNNKRFIVVSSGPDLFLLDTNSPITAYRIPNNSCPQDECRNCGVSIVEQIGDEKFRFIMDVRYGNGRLGGEPIVFVHDIDFLNKTTTDEEVTFAQDLRGDGHCELIVGAEVAFGVNWYWIYEYKDGNWVDSSKEFPNYYKNEVKKLMEKYHYFDPKVGYIHEALTRAAEKGGPCCP